MTRSLFGIASQSTHQSSQSRISRTFGASFFRARRHSAEAPAAGVEHLLTYGGDRYVNTRRQRAKSAKARRAAATSATAPRSQRQPITSAR
jgi:hypothetical protein